MRVVTFSCVVLALATAISFPVEGDDPKDLQEQLAVAEHREPADNAAIAEISRRILKIDPHNNQAWEKRVRALLDLGDLKRCGEALDEWQKPENACPPVAVDLAGDLAFEREAYAKALDCWNQYLTSQPRKPKTYEKIAWEYEVQEQWAKAEGTLTKLIAVKDSAGTRVWRARCRMELRHWDNAIEDINKANEIDASDDAVKEWLPQFETLERSLPKIKELDRKISGNKLTQPWRILDRGLLFNGAERYDMACQDADAALAIVPDSKRAILQKAQAFIALKRVEDAAKLQVIVANNNFTDAALQKIGALDAKREAKPGDASLLVERARACSDIEQYAFALEDAQAAVKLSPKLADALVETGFARMKLSDAKKAKRDFIRATDLDPRNAVAWRSLGELAMDLADYPAAIDNFSRSLKLHESPLVLLKREQCYRNSGHDREADQDHQRWQKLTGKSSPAPASTPHLNKQ